MSRKTTPTYVLLNQITLAADTLTVSFSNVPQNYSDLVLVFAGRNTATCTNLVTLNGDVTDGNYLYVNMLGNGSTTSAGSGTGRPTFNTGSQQSNSFVQFMDYSASDKHKTYLVRSNANGNYLFASAMRWANTAPITSIKIDGAPNAFAGGSTFYLYGLVA